MSKINVSVPRCYRTAYTNKNQCIKTRVVSTTRNITVTPETRNSNNIRRDKSQQQETATIYKEISLNNKKHN